DLAFVSGPSTFAERAEEDAGVEAVAVHFALGLQHEVLEVGSRINLPRAVRDLQFAALGDLEFRLLGAIRAPPFQVRTMQQRLQSGGIQLNVSERHRTAIGLQAYVTNGDRFRIGERDYLLIVERYHERISRSDDDERVPRFRVELLLTQGP